MVRRIRMLNFTFVVLSGSVLGVHRAWTVSWKCITVDFFATVCDMLDICIIVVVDPLTSGNIATLSGFCIMITSLADKVTYVRFSIPCKSYVMFIPFRAKLSFVYCKQPCTVIAQCMHRVSNCTVIYVIHVYSIECMQSCMWSTHAINQNSA